MTDTSPMAVVERFCELYNDGTPDSYGSDRYTSLYAEEVVVEYGASERFPQGRRLEGKPRMLKELERVSGWMRNRYMSLREALQNGDSVVIGWSFWATTAVDMPGVPAGSRLRSDGVDFYTVRDGLIVYQKQYAGPMVPSRDGDDERAAPDRVSL